MATINEIIARVDENKPNDFSASVKLRWIALLDGKIAASVFLMDIVEARKLAYAYPADLETEPLVSFPHDDIYDLWLGAKIDFENGEYNKYQNAMEMFNSQYGDFVRWFADTYEPAQELGCVCRENRYYISAYGLAVKHGYQGTEEEWIQSLQGPKGEPGEAVEVDKTLMREGCAADAKATGDLIKSHTDNKSNPHGVTAAQVGAVPAVVSGGDTLTWDGNTEGVTIQIEMGGEENSYISYHRSNVVLTPADITNGVVFTGSFDDTDCVANISAGDISFNEDGFAMVSLEFNAGSNLYTNAAYFVPVDNYVASMYDGYYIARFPTKGIWVDHVNVTSITIPGYTGFGSASIDPAYMPTASQVGAAPASHTEDKNNPHGVTATQVGLGNVDNTSDADKPVSTAQATAIADAKKAGTDAQTNLNTHTNNKSNPHGVTAGQVGLQNFRAYYFVDSDASGGWISVLQENWEAMTVGTFIIDGRYSGSMAMFIGYKTSNLYGAAIMFYYNNATIFHYRLSNGTWYESTK